MWQTQRRRGAENAEGTAPKKSLRALRLCASAFSNYRTHLPIFAALSLAGCSSLDLPDLTATGRDARTYNPQTGRYEWPDDEPARQPAKPRVRERGDAPRADAAPPDGRDYNPQTGRFESPRE